jgi:hypothetical protein
VAGVVEVSAPGVAAVVEVQDSDNMKSSGRIIGIILVAAAALLCLGVGAWLASESAGGGLTLGGAALGGLLALIIAAPLVGVGVYLLIQGGREERSMAEVQQERKLLKNWIYDLVGKGLFSGYVNWEEGVLYSEQASQLRGETRCKHCGGQIQLAGKGVVSCPYCGTEYFLS